MLLAKSLLGAFYIIIRRLRRLATVLFRMVVDTLLALHDNKFENLKQFTWLHKVLDQFNFTLDKIGPDVYMFWQVGGKSQCFVRNLNL